VRQLRHNGYTVVTTDRRHIAVLDADGNRVHTLPKTPSDHRWYQNAVTQMKRKGLISEDPRGNTKRRRERRKTNTGGQSPPPLPDLNFDRKDSPMPRTSLTLTEDVIVRAYTIFDAVAKEFALEPPRKGKTTSHGSAIILAHVIEAYERASGRHVPSPNYKQRDMSDRMEMSRLAANRVQDFTNDSIGAATSEPALGSLEFAEDAWKWFAEEAAFDFPDGRVLTVYGSGILVSYPYGPPGDNGVKEDAAADGGGDDIHRIQMAAERAGLFVRQIDENKVRLAIEVAVKTGDADLGLRVAGLE
jgi:hypothetical protein